jgi:hypothetical protein
VDGPPLVAERRYRRVAPGSTLAGSGAALSARSAFGAIVLKVRSVEVVTFPDASALRTW